MKGKCKLYQIDCELQNSHLIPKFIFDYFKKTGGYMRKFENPNLRVQDGPKKYLLGKKAEETFNVRETWFANNIFYPYQRDNITPLKYDENLGYFIISVLWRVLVDQLDHPSVKNNPKLSFLKDVSEEWRLFLSEYKYPINYDDLNIILTSRVSSHNMDALYADLYTTRTIDATVISNEDDSTVGVYVKFLRFMIWSIVKGHPTNGENLKVNFDHGEIELPQSINDDYFVGFLKNRMENIDKGSNASEKQQLIIQKELEKNEQNFWRSDAGNAIINDFQNRDKSSK